MYKKFGKRILDIILSISGILLLFPAFIIILVALRLSSERKPIFRQQRPGLNEQLFFLLKFKSMRDNPAGKTLNDQERITAIGRFLRKTSLDEIPQLWNVLRGDMSIVGPRPLLVEYLPLYNQEQKKRHTIRPGMTGLAQVNGRNNISWNQKFAFDIWYVDHISLRTDVTIIFKTFLAILLQSQPVACGDLPIEKFAGNEHPFLPRNK